MSRGDPTLIHATRIAEPPRRSSLDPSTTKNVRRAAVAGPKNNHTHTTMGSMDYNILQNRANAYPTPSHIPRPDFALGYMADLPQQASRNTELPRRPGHAPHGSAPETILGMQDQHFPLSNPQGYRSSRPVADGVHPRTDIDRPPQPPSPTLLRILNGEYTDRFGQTRSVPSSLLAPLAQQQPEQSPQPPLNISPPSVLGPVPVKTPHERVIDKPPARRVEEDTRPARRTNVICRNFQKGLCRNQDCPRAHVLDLSPDMIALLPLGKQRTPNVQVPAVVSESVRKSNVELCKLNLVGKCPHGTSCKYSHDLGTGDPNPSPEPTPVAGSSRLPDPHLDTSVPSRVIHALPQKPSTDTEPGGAAPSTSTHRNPNYIVYPDDVCRNHIQGRCQHPRCKYKHWSREEVQAFRAANRAAQEASPMLDADTSTAQVSLSAASPLPPAEDARASRAHPVAAVLHDTPAPDSSSAGDDEPGPNDHKPPSTVRKCKQKKRRNGGRSSDRDGEAPSPGDEGTEVGKGEREREEKNKTSGKGKSVAESVKSKVDNLGTPEKADKGKSKAKKKGAEGKEKDVGAEPSSGKVKGNAEKVPSPRRANTEEAPPKGTVTPTEQRGKVTDRKGKGVARPALQDIDKQCTSGPAPGKGPPPPNDKRNSAKKTGVAQTTAPGPSRGQVAADDTETESVSSYASFYSARDSAVVTAQTSLSSVDGPSSSKMAPKGICWDYLKGHCYRTLCKFSHDVDRTLYKSSKAPQPSTTQTSTQPKTQPRSNDTSHRSLDRTSQTRMDASARTGDPLVPPGLGLESVVANGGDGTLPRQSETVTITVHDSTKVTFSSGFGVVQVITSFESRQIILQNVPPTVTRRDITTTLQTTFGEIVAVLPGDSQDGPLSWRITFAQADAAAEASAALNGSCLFDVRVTARMAEKKSVGIGGGTLFDGDVLFELPTPRLKAYIGYETKEQADRAIALSNRKEIKGMWVTAGMYQGIPMVGAFNVRIEGLHPDSTVKDLGQFGKFQTHMFERPKYTSMPAAISALHNILLRKDERVTINVLPPPYRKMFRIWAHFSDKAIAKATCEDLHKFCPSFTGKLRIYAHHITSLRYNLPPAIFDIIAYDINLLRDYNLDDKGTSISVIDRRQGASSPTAPVLVKLVSQDMSALSRLKAGFDQLLRGEKVTENGQVVWNDFFKSPAGMEYLAELEKMYPKVRINRDPRRRTLALFGREPHRSRVREEIIARTRLLKAQRQRRYPVAGDLIGVFMSEDLFKLQSELGHDNVWFDLTNKELVVRGDENAQKVAGLAVRHAVQRRQRRVAPADAACTVCFDDVSHPITLSCGHRWCRDCLTGYMHASVDNKTFPLKCLGDDAKCPQCIPLALAQELLTPDEFDAIVRASFLAHVQSRPDEFHYCPTPDCPQVYHKTKRNTILQCPSCLVRICPHCDTEWHQNGSCQESDPQDDLLFEQWKSRHDVKDCPSCKVPIERMAGCNHMTCVSCKTHICWACLATFPTSQEVYDHMRGIHGGIGL